MRQPIQVAIYCARRSGNIWEYLMLHRIPKNGNFWQGVTGGVEDDESIIATARRELREETGFDPIDLIDLGYSHAFAMRPEWEHIYPGGHSEITEHVFLAVVDHGLDPVLSPIEHDAFRWCTLNEALELLYWDSNKESLRYCHNLLQNPG